MSEYTTISQVLRTLDTYDPRKNTAPGNLDHPNADVSLAMHLAVELYTDEVVRLLNQHIENSFTDWLREFDIESTKELQIHFWKWATENDYTGRHTFCRVVKQFVDGLGCRVARKD